MNTTTLFIGIKTVRPFEKWELIKTEIQVRPPAKL